MRTLALMAVIGALACPAALGAGDPDPAAAVAPGYRLAKVEAPRSWNLSAQSMPIPSARPVVSRPIVHVPARPAVIPAAHSVPVEPLSQIPVTAPKKVLPPPQTTWSPWNEWKPR